MFEDRCGGTYRVEAIPPANMFASRANASGNPANDSNPNPSAVTLAASNSQDLTVDFGFYAGAGCAYTQGYWKNHEEAWPVSSLVLGKLSYSNAELLTILLTPARGDSSITSRTSSSRPNSTC